MNRTSNLGRTINWSQPTHWHSHQEAIQVYDAHLSLTTRTEYNMLRKHQCVFQTLILDIFTDLLFGENVDSQYFPIVYKNTVLEEKETLSRSAQCGQLATYIHHSRLYLSIITAETILYTSVYRCVYRCVYRSVYTDTSQAVTSLQ